MKIALDRFENYQILPVIWMEVMSGVLSEELRSMIYHSTFSANAIQLSFKYGTLLVGVASLGMLVATLYYCGRNRKDKEGVRQDKQTVYQMDTKLRTETETLKVNNELLSEDK